MSDKIQLSGIHLHWMKYHMTESSRALSDEWKLYFKVVLCRVRNVDITRTQQFWELCKTTILVPDSSVISVRSFFPYSGGWRQEFLYNLGTVSSRFCKFMRNFSADARQFCMFRNESNIPPNTAQVLLVFHHPQNNPTGETKTTTTPSPNHAQKPQGLWTLFWSISSQGLSLWFDFFNSCGGFHSSQHSPAWSANLTNKNHSTVLYVQTRTA